MNRGLIILLSMILAGTLLTSACAVKDNAGSRLGYPAPEFRLQDAGGQMVTLSSLRGKIVWLNFWTTTCPDCIAEMPYIQSYYNSLTNQDVAVLAVNAGESPSTVKSFLQKRPYSFPVLLDSQYEVAGKYSVRYFPTHIFIDPEGKLQSKVIGAFRNQAAIERHISGLLP